ncbi:MAG: cell division protein FtsL [Bacillota bacterium]
MRSKKSRDYNSSQYSGTKSKSSANTKNKITNSKTMLVIMLIIFIIVLFFIMYINQYVQISRKSLAVEKLEDEKRNLESKKDHLQLKIARLRSLERVERIAKGDLNMEEPDNINYIVLDSIESEAKSKIKPKTEEDNSQQVAKDEQEKIAINLKQEFSNWLNDLTTVQAGTLQE